MRAGMVSLIFFVASTASAQQVYKCVRGSEVSYQSAACDGTQKVARQWDATPQPDPTPGGFRQRQPRSQRGNAESARLSHAAVTDRAHSTGKRAGPAGRK